jgi:hypothetical protein
LIHLFISDMIWIALILLVANALAIPVAVTTPEGSQAHSASLAERTA